MPAERVVVGQKMLMESGHGSTMKHHRGEVSEHGAFDIVAQEHGLSIGHFHQRGVGCLLLDDRAVLMKLNVPRTTTEKKVFARPLASTIFLFSSSRPISSRSH